MCLCVLMSFLFSLSLPSSTVPLQQFFFLLSLNRGSSRQHANEKKKGGGGGATGEINANMMGAVCSFSLWQEVQLQANLQRSNKSTRFPGFSFCLTAGMKFCQALGNL